MKKSCLKFSLLTACISIFFLAKGQNRYFAGDLAVATKYNSTANFEKYRAYTSIVGGISSSPLFNLDHSISYSFNSQNATQESIDSWDSQTNISNFNGNGLKITATGNAYSQDAITYQSGLNGGGAGIAFGRGPSWDTFMGFYTNQIDNGGTGNIMERMRLDHNGNLGIGTIHPHEKLTVNGTIVAKKVKVSIQEGEYADYVFASGYKLRSLASVEKFIKRFKHLPGVPSAREVQNAGLDIGTSQVLLLQKIEELTLYLLRQNDEIKDLKKRVAAFSTSKK